MDSSMKNPTHGHVIGIPISSISYAASEDQLYEAPASIPDPESKHIHTSSYEFYDSTQKRKDPVLNWMYSYVQGIREHVTLAPKMSKTMKGKMSLSRRMIQAGGVEKFFKQAFSVGNGEKLLNASQCYISTTAGPIAGLLFISTEKVAFHSDRSLRLASPKGESIRVPYKVLIPLKRIKCAISSENSNKPTQKYIQIATVDEFDFWFMGFISYNKSFKYLEQVNSELS